MAQADPNNEALKEAFAETLHEQRDSAPLAVLRPEPEVL